jgi:Fe2+ or Zn2+ uptake regulation protein
VDPARLDEILALVRARGGRVTTSRRAIVSALLAAQGHVTAEDLAASVQAQYPDVHTSTVYRCLETLAELGIIEHVHLGHGPAVYHLTNEGHQHLVCESCHAVIEVPDHVFAAVAYALETDFGFTPSLGHFAILGRCATCLAASSRRPRAKRPATAAAR